MCPINETRVLVLNLSNTPEEKYNNLFFNFGKTYIYSSLKQLNNNLSDEKVHLVLIDVKELTSEVFNFISNIKNKNPNCYVVLIVEVMFNLEMFEYVIDKIFVKPYNEYEFENYLQETFLHILYDNKIKNYKKLLENLFLGISNLPISILITDKNGLIEYVNPYFLKITKYSLNEIIGRKANIIKSNKHNTEFYKEMWETILAGKTWASFICNKDKEGNLFWGKLVIYPVYEGDEIVNFIGINSNITEQREQELELSAILESLDDYFYIFDESYICFKNFPEKNIFNEQKVCGLKIEDIFEKDIATLFIETFEKIKSDPLYSLTTYIEYKDKTFETIIKKYNSNRFIVWFRDITDKIKLRVLSEMSKNIKNLIEINENLIKSLN